MRIPMLTAAVLALSMLQAVAAFAQQEWLGVNLQNARDYQPNNMFADAMKSSRGWGSPRTPWDLAAQVDADGWPTGDAGIVVKTGRANNIGGTYALSFTGRATVTPIGPGLRIQNLVYNAETNASSGELVVDDAVMGIMLSFTGTNGGVRNVKLIRPGHTTETFNRDFIELIRPFRSLRFMWTTETIDNPVVRWQDRTLPTHATQARQAGGVYYGMAWEYVVELCNETGKDMWICIPDLADDDYITNLATLLKNSVNPNVNIYVEFSNEVWNNGYQQTRRNAAAAQAEVAAGNSILNYDGEVNPGYLAWRRVGLKTKQISDLFRAVFGDEAMMTQVRPVLCMWNASNMSIRQPLEFLEANFGAPRNYLYGIANAPYFGLPADVNERTDLTVDECITHMQATLTNSLNLARNFSAWAQWYGLKFMMYEGGLDMHGAASLAVKVQTQRDPRTAALLRQFFDGCNAIALDHLSFFTSISADTEFGMDGLTTRLDDLEHPKYQAMLQAVAAPPAPVTIGTAVPGVIPAGNFDIQSAFVAPGNPTVTLANRGWYNYIIRVPHAGTYSITPSAAAIATGGSIEALTSQNVFARSWTVSSPTFSDLASVEVPLRAGLNVIRMRSISGNVSLRSISVNAVHVPLALASVPMATPSEVDVGAEVSFSAAFSGNGVTMSWNFGDGTPAASGEQASHVYAAPGTYSVIVTATDVAGQTLTGMVSVTVNAVVVPPPPVEPDPETPVEPDTETPVEPDTELPETPVVPEQPNQPEVPEQPLNPEAPTAPEENTPVTRPMIVTAMKGMMVPDAIDADSCTISAVLNAVPAGAIANGTSVEVSVGDWQGAFTLSGRGSARSHQGSLNVKLPKKGAAGDATFKLVLKRVTLMQDAQEGAMPMNVSIRVGGVTFSSTIDVNCVETPKAMRFSK